jgi:hypothetical protein
MRNIFDSTRWAQDKQYDDGEAMVSVRPIPSLPQQLLQQRPLLFQRIEGLG